MQLNNKNINKGFTFVELIVVLVIISIIAAVFVPTLSGYIDKQKQKVAISECKDVVDAAQMILAGMVADDKQLGNFYNDKKDKVMSLANSSGELTGMIVEDEKLSILTYRATNNLEVLYESGVYTVMEETSLPGMVGEIAYLTTVDTQGKTSSALSHLYQRELILNYGGYSALTEAENSMYASLGGNNTNFTWKPLSDKNGNIFMIASSNINDENDIEKGQQGLDPSPNLLAYLIFYNNTYYYHTTPIGAPNSNWTSDSNFDVNLLSTAPSTADAPQLKNDTWVRIIN